MMGRGWTGMWVIYIGIRIKSVRVDSGRGLSENERKEVDRHRGIFGNW
jgi:hypothetical protein